MNLAFRPGRLNRGAPVAPFSLPSAERPYALGVWRARPQLRTRNRETRMSDAKITIRENGPYRVEGDVPLFDHLGNRIEPPKPGGYSLCRCGASSNRPFCDGTHSRIGFIGAQAAAAAADAQKGQP